MLLSSYILNCLVRKMCIVKLHALSFKCSSILLTYFSVCLGLLIWYSPVLTHSISEKMKLHPKVNCKTEWYVSFESQYWCAFRQKIDCVHCKQKHIISRSQCIMFVILWYNSLNKIGSPKWDVCKEHTWDWQTPEFAFFGVE